MRSLLVTLAVIAIGSFLGCRHATVVSVTQPLELIARFHFVGGAQLTSGTNATGLKELLALPASKALREATVTKLAKAPYELVKLRATAGAPEHAALIRPLLEDLLDVESYAELRGAANQTPELAWAIQLSEARAQVWSRNLSTVLSEWTGIRTRSIKLVGFKGWELKKHHEPNLFRLVHAGQWVVISCGQDQLPLQTEILQRIKSQSRPIPVAGDYWLTAWTDWPRLSQRIGNPLPFELPQTQLTVSGGRIGVHTKMSLSFLHPLKWDLEPWQIPTNIIGDSVVSFTAVRGIAPWLSKLKAALDLGINPVPNQFCSWAESQTPFRTFFAVPTQSASNLFTQLAPRLMSSVDTNLGLRHLGRANWQTNDSELVWRGLPLVAPFLRGIHDNVGDFLVAGLIPIAMKEKPPLQEFLSPLAGRTNLVYYDWERSADRLPQIRLLNQAYRLILNQPQRRADAPGSQWLDVLASKLGPAITEVSLVRSNELSFVRESTIGLTAFELERFTAYLDRKDFPLCGYQLAFHAPGQAVKTPTTK